MRTGSGNRSNYNRTTGSRTARLYSKRTAQRINKEYQHSQAQRIRNIQYNEETDDFDLYDEYYDDPNYTVQEERRGRKTFILAVSITAAILALVVAGLYFLYPGTRSSASSGLRIDPAIVRTAIETSPEEAEPYTDAQEQTQGTAEDQTTAQEPQTTTFEESDPPVIYGVMPIVVYADHSVAYKQGIHVTDDNDPSPILEVDNADVDLSTPGTYIITYIARDRNGNATRVPSTVTVLPGKNIVKDEDIYALADSILDVIITDEDDTDALKCLKVYEYLHAIGYVDEVHSEDWMQNAYWMLQKREGDCFCYYSAARLLLTRLGYDVMEVRNNNNYVHFWCLVSIDGGQTWWHFDPTCWSWGEDGVLCLVSDTYLDEFTQRHKTSDGRLIHSWDRTNYPPTPETDFWTDQDREVIYEGGLIELDDQNYLNNYNWDENEGWDYYPVSYTFDDYGYDYYDDTYEENTEAEISYETEYTESDYITPSDIDAFSVGAPETGYEEPVYEEDYQEDAVGGIYMDAETWAEPEE